MHYPTELHYTRDHEWISATSGEVVVGVTSYAVDQLGDIVHLDLPKVGQSFSRGQAFGTIESTKTVSDLYMPLAGKVVAVNEDLLSHPESLQKEAYGEGGWLLKVSLTDTGEGSELLDSQAYRAFLKS